MSLFNWKIVRKGVTGQAGGYDYAEFHEDEHVSRKNSGAFAELVICADLLKRGYEVFRSVSAHASCDLLAQKEGRIYRIEVRTAHFICGQVRWASKNERLLANKESGNASASLYDILAAFVREQNRIVYFSTKQEVEL